MCGGDLNIEADINVIECEYCGTTQTVPTADNEKKVNLFNRANRLRLNSEFDKAAGIYESIIAEFPEEAEAYWGLCLCNHGIEYVDDPATAKKVPTCHRASFEKLANDENFNMAMEYADVVAQKLYRDEAREIDRIMDNILSISKNEKPYDVFICYKETDEQGERTIDSVIAQDVYDTLTSKGMKVFFARISLEDKLGQMYEPYIFAALNSAKVMLAIGTKYEHFHAVWVKNEWSRFLKLMAKDKTKVLIPCYKDMDAYDLPDEFKALQSQDMGKIGFMQDLVRGIEKVTEINIHETKIVKETVVTNTVSVNNSLAAPLIERAFMFLEEEKWSSADEYCEKALDLEPKNAQAYLGKLLANKYKHNIHELKYLDKNDLISDEYFEKTMRFADEELTSMLNDTVQMIDKIDLNKEIVEHKINVLDATVSEKKSVSHNPDLTDSYIKTPAEKLISEKENNIRQLKSEISMLGLFKRKEKDALNVMINKENSEIDELRKIAIAEKKELVEKHMQEFLNENKDKIEEIESRIQTAKEDLYQFGLELIENEDFFNAKTIFKKLSGYKDSKEKLDLVSGIVFNNEEFEIICPTCGCVINIGLDIVEEGSMKCHICGEIMEFEFD